MLGLRNDFHKSCKDSDLSDMLNKMGTALLRAKETLENDKSTDSWKKILDKAINYCASVVEHTLDLLKSVNDKLYEIYEKEDNTLKSQIISGSPRPPV